jgi:hypothetical protein
MNAPRRAIPGLFVDGFFLGKKIFMPPFIKQADFVARLFIRVLTREPSRPEASGQHHQATQPHR